MKKTILSLLFVTLFLGGGVLLAQDGEQNPQPPVENEAVQSQGPSCGKMCPGVRQEMPCPKECPGKGSPASGKGTPSQEMGDGEWVPPMPLPGHGPHDHGGMPGMGPMGERGNPQRFFEELKEKDPAEYERLLKLRVENREEFMREMGRLMPRPQREFYDRQQMERDRECWQIARELRECKDEARKAELTARLEAKVSELMDGALQQTQKQLEEMKRRIQEIQENREEVLKRRVDFYLNAPLPPPPPHRGEAPATSAEE